MPNDLQQQLWELIYDLLPEDDAQKLREQITSDPDVARAYATVKLQSEAVARAARYETPTIAWQRDANGHAVVERSAVASIGQPAAKPRASRVANWLVSIAAIGLVCVLGTDFWWTLAPREPATMMADAGSVTPIQTVVAGPSKLHPEVGAQFNVRTADIHGTPVSAPLTYRVFDDTGSVMFEQDQQTNSAGTTWFDLPASVTEKAVRLEVIPGHESAVAVSQPLQSAADRFATYVRTDKPLYRPGETVLYRSVTLSRFGLKADHEQSVDFGIVGSNGEPLPNSQHTSQTEQGVASGSFALPDDLNPGQYSLQVTSPDRSFANEWRDFEVESFTTPRWKKELALDRDSYALGDEVKAKLKVELAEGEPLAKGRVAAQALFGAQPVDIEPGQTDSKGNFDLYFRVPENLDSVAANLSVTVTADDDVTESISKEIPLNFGSVNVAFYPEGGDLVAGVSNRVYFQSRDPRGDPVHIEGHISDSNDQTLTNLATQHEGRGRFAFTPASGETYRLILDAPADGKKEIPLPPASADQSVALNTGNGVFEADAPLDLTLSTPQPATAILVAAYCRGAMIGQTNLGPADFVESAGGYVCSTSLPLVGDAQGVIRVSVFDTRESPPRPIAERLVFRRISRQLEVDISSPQESYAPGDAVQLKLGVYDEGGAPVAAALGVSVVDDALLSLADDKSTRMPTYFHLLTEIAAPEELEDANFYLSDDPEAAAALDLLLGTQGWRKFAEVPLNEFAGAAGRQAGAYGFAYHKQSWAQTDTPLYAIPLDSEAVVPVLVNNTLAIRSLNSKPPAVTPAPVPVRSNWWPWVSTAGGGVLLLALAALAWLRIRMAWKVWLPSLAVACGVLLVGLWTAPRAERQQGPTVIARVESASPTAESRDAIATKAMLDLQQRAEPSSPGGVEVADNLGMQQAPEMDRKLEALPAERDGAAKSPEALNAPQLGDAAEELNRRMARSEEMRKDTLQEQAVPAPTESAPAPPAPVAPADPGAPAAGPAAGAAAVPPPASKLAMAEADKAFSPEFSRARALGGLKASLDDTVRLDEDKRRVRLFAFGRWSEVSPNGPSGTVYWNALLPVDDSGAATIDFRLPAGTTSYRAIVEAHGAGRLGSGEKLIIAAPPSDKP